MYREHPATMPPQGHHNFMRIGDQTHTKTNRPRHFFPRASLSNSACMLISAYIFFSRRFSSSIAFIWLIIDTSMPPYLERHLQKEALLIPCSRHNSGTGKPPSAWRRIARIYGSVNLLIFIKISSIMLSEKILLLKPVIFREDYQWMFRACSPSWRDHRRESHAPVGL